MARRPDSQQNIRSITRLGCKSFAVTIPINAIRALGWKEKQKVVVRVSRGRVIISESEE